MIREYANRFWRVLVQSDRVFKEFRSRFCGKCSPVHFFWGSFDLAVTRFSGRPAPPHPGGVPHLPDAVTREAYSSGSKQSRFLARQRGCADATLLFVCVSGTAWIRRGENSAGCGFLRDQTARIHPALRRGAHWRKAGSSPPRLCAERLRRGVEAGEVGPRRTGGEEASLAFASATFVIKRNESWLRSRATCLA